MIGQNGPVSLSWTPWNTFVKARPNWTNSCSQGCGAGWRAMWVWRALEKGPPPPAECIKTHRRSLCGMACFILWSLLDVGWPRALLTAMGGRVQRSSQLDRLQLSLLIWNLLRNAAIIKSILGGRFRMNNWYTVTYCRSVGNAGEGKCAEDTEKEMRELQPGCYNAPHTSSPPAIRNKSLYLKRK